MRRTAAIAIAILCAAVWATPAQAAFSDYGLASVEASISTTQAGGHPDLEVGFEVKTDPASPPSTTGRHRPYAQTKDVTIGLPPGLIGNINAVAQCTAAQFATAFDEEGGGCPPGSQIGVARVQASGTNFPFVEPIYNLEPPPGAPARLGLYVGPVAQIVEVGVRTDGDYGLNSVTEGITTFEELASAEVTVWGTPGAHVHDTERLTPEEANVGVEKSPPRESGLPQILPFLQNATHCGASQEVFVEATTYQVPGLISRKAATLPPLTGCGALRFHPEFTAIPTTSEAAAPSGIDATLRIPQEEGTGDAASQMKDAVVTFPEGMTLAPGAANGLASCSAAQAGYGVSPPVPSDCPAASKLGSATFDVPQLPRPIEGSLYQRDPAPGDLFRVWLISDELGVHVKLPGEVHLDHATGQVTSLFLDNPQVPLRELQLHVFGGPRGPFETPSVCGTYQTHWQFTPWSGTPAVASDTPMRIDTGCDTGGFSPTLSAGTTDPTAGSYTSFVLDLGRAAGEQNIEGLSLTLPEGLLARPAAVSLCPDSLAGAGNCPADSQIGTVSAAVGPGPYPLWVPQAGKDPTAVYLAGPYKSAPYSLVVKVPAQAGPFDLGTVITRAATYIDPRTAEVTAVSDPLPQILEGVPASYRQIHVQADRPGFMLNPTSCEAQQVKGSLSSPQGSQANPSARFQASDCAHLAFKPALDLRLKGPTRRGGFPALRGAFKPRRGDADLGKLVVRLPHSAFLEQGHIRTICTRVQYAADGGHGAGCPAASAYGHVRAFTPLLDQPLEGPVFLRSSNHNLPDMVLSLHGEVDFEAVGRIDSKNGGIRASFEGIPDAPLTKVVLNMQGGRKGLIVNSTDLCRSKNRANAAYLAHNGRRATGKPLMRAVKCRKSHRKRHRGHHKRQHAGGKHKGNKH